MIEIYAVSNIQKLSCKKKKKKKEKKRSPSIEIVRSQKCSIYLPRARPADKDVNGGAHTPLKIRMLSPTAKITFLKQIFENVKFPWRRPTHDEFNPATNIYPPRISTNLNFSLIPSFSTHAFNYNKFELYKKGKKKAIKI